MTTRRCWVRVRRGDLRRGTARTRWGFLAAARCRGRSLAGGCAGADLGGRVKGARGGPWMASVSGSPSIGGIAPASSAKPVHERLEDGGKRASIPCLVENDPPRGSLAMIGHCRNQLRFLELLPSAIGPGRSSAAERGRPLIRPSRFRAGPGEGLDSEDGRTRCCSNAPPVALNTPRRPEASGHDGPPIWHAPD